MSAQTSFFAEDRHNGFYRLQTTEPRLIQVMNERAKQPRSPWQVTGRGLTQSDPMIYRRTFSSSTKAREWFDRTLMRMDDSEYKLSPVSVGFGWEVLRPSEEKKTPSVANMTPECCESSPKTMEAA